MNYEDEFEYLSKAEMLAVAGGNGNDEEEEMERIEVRAPNFLQFSDWVANAGVTVTNSWSITGGYSAVGTVTGTESQSVTGKDYDGDKLIDDDHTLGDLYEDYIKRVWAHHYGEGDIP